MVWEPSLSSTLGKQLKPVVTSKEPLLVWMRSFRPEVSSHSPTVYSSLVGSETMRMLSTTCSASATSTGKVQVLPM